MPQQWMNLITQRCGVQVLSSLCNLFVSAEYTVFIMWSCNLCLKELLIENLVNEIQEIKNNHLQYYKIISAQVKTWFIVRVLSRGLYMQYSERVS